MPEQLYWWIGFHIFIFLMLALDLCVPSEVAYGNRT